MGQRGAAECHVGGESGGRCGIAPDEKGLSLTVDELSDLEKQILVERHLISRELSNAKRGAGW